MENSLEQLKTTVKIPVSSLCQFFLLRYMLLQIIIKNLHTVIQTYPQCTGHLMHGRWGDDLPIVSFLSCFCLPFIPLKAGSLNLNNQKTF